MYLNNNTNKIYEILGVYKMILRKAQKIKFCTEVNKQNFFKNNKIIINTASIYMNSENCSNSKKLENYSFSTCDTLGKGYSSCVYKGRNDLTSIFFLNQIKLQPSKLSI